MPQVRLEHYSDSLDRIERGKFSRVVWWCVPRSAVPLPRAINRRRISITRAASTMSVITVNQDSIDVDLSAGCRDTNSLDGGQVGGNLSTLHVPRNQF